MSRRARRAIWNQPPSGASDVRGGGIKGSTVRSVRSFLRARGFDVTRYPHAYSLQANLAAVLAVHGINCVLDVGAHHGQFGKGLRSQGYAGRIVSFEPSSDAQPLLLEAASFDRNWSVRAVALGRQPGVATIHLFRNSIFNSLHEPSDHTRELFTDAVRVGEEQIEVSTLDHEYQSSVKGITNPRVLLKSDTQGHDLDVIEGGLGVLPEISAILVELSVSPIYRGQPGFIAVYGRLIDLGFRPSGMFPVAWGTDHLSVIEFDGVFVRRSRAL
jgi:FkbM family methyltransferase